MEHVESRTEAKHDCSPRQTHPAVHVLPCPSGRLDLHGSGIGTIVVDVLALGRVEALRFEGRVCLRGNLRQGCRLQVETALTVPHAAVFATPGHPPTRVRTMGMPIAAISCSSSGLSSAS